MPDILPLTHSELFDLLPDFVCVVGPDGTFQMVNAACLGVLGYQPAELLGRLMIDFVHPDDRMHTLEIARRVASGQYLPYFENRWLRKDGSVAHLMWSARWSERHQVRVAMARDVTGQRD